MRALFRVFLTFILKVTALFTVGSIIGILALDKLFGGYEFYLGMLVFIAPLLAWTITFMLVPKNLDWILALPISKRNVLVLHYITSVVCSAVILLSSIFILVVLTLIKSDTRVSYEQAARAAQKITAEAQVGTQLGNYVAGIDIYGWMTGLLMLSFFHALSMSISRPTTTKRLYQNFWNHANPYIRWGSRTGWVVIIAIAALLRDHMFSPFGIFVLATIVFLFFTTLNTTHALGIPKRQKRRWLGVSGAVATTQIVFLFLHAMNGVRSEEFDRRVASVMFLGPFSGGIAKADLARLLEAKLNADRTRELGEFYIKKYADGHKIHVYQDRDVSFRRAIADKKGYQDVIATLGLFEASELGREDILALFAKLQPLMAECRCEFSGYELISARLKLDDVIALLKSGNDVAANFALLKARYLRSEAVIPVIHRELPKFSDKVKLAALRTLSVLHGRHYTFEDWLRVREGGRAVSKSEFFRVDCRNWAPRSIAELKPQDMGALNACIREVAELSVVQSIESLGWMELPLDSRAQAVVRKVFHIR